MTSRLASFALATILALTAAGSVMASEEGPVTPVNLAGEQRMLSQRVVKAYAQIGLNVMPGVASGQISAGIQRFEANLQKLAVMAAASPAAQAALENLRKDWLLQREAVAAPVSRVAALEVSRRAEAVLVSAERLTRVLEDEGKSAADPLINLAGRQRMLAQRIAKDYLLRSWGVESSALREEMESAINEFAGGLARLRARPDNSDVLRRELDEIGQQWEWLQAALSVEGADSYRLIVAESADAILEATERVTRLVEQSR